MQKVRKVLKLSLCVFAFFLYEDLRQKPSGM